MRSVLALVALALAVASPIAAKSPPVGHPPQQEGVCSAPKGDHNKPHKRVAKVVKGKPWNLKEGDIKILNFLLTLEFIEASFFSQGVQKFKKAAFKKEPKLLARFQDIATHESDHVATLKQALGNNAVLPCEYDFGRPMNTVESFIAASRVLETVGASAYLGATPLLSTPELIGASGSILAIEARHSSLLNENEGGNGFPTSFETPLNFNQVWTIAHGVIKPGTCGAKKPLPDGLAAFPDLFIVVPKAGKRRGNKWTVFLTSPAFAKTKGHSTQPKLYVAFLNNGKTAYAPLEFGDDPKVRSVQPPKDLKGATYIIVTSSATGLTNKNTVAGPTVKFF